MNDMALAWFWCDSRACCGASSTPPQQKLNVLFLIADDSTAISLLRPLERAIANIDKLAARGVRFERSLLPVSLVQPEPQFVSHGPPSDDDADPHDPGRPLSRPIPRDAAFPRVHTGHCHDAPGIPPERLLRGTRGKLYHYGVPGQIGTAGSTTSVVGFLCKPAGLEQSRGDRIFSLVPGSYCGVLTGWLLDGTDYEQTDGLAATAAVSLLEERRDKPFFLAVGFYRPHTPYVAPKKYFDLYPLDKIPLPALSSDDQSRTPAPAYGSARKEQDAITDRQRREAIQAYWASTTYMDAQLGRVLDALDRLGLARTPCRHDDDHGYHLYTPVCGRR